MESTEYTPLEVLDIHALLLGQYLDGEMTGQGYMITVAGHYSDAFGNDD